jgi:hypothetical protein
MPTFCRHNRFIERCPVCSGTLPGNEAGRRAPRGAGPARPSAGEKPRRARAPGGTAVRIQREGRALQDGYSSELLPGVRASGDAHRLAQEIAFSSARLHALEAAPPGLYGEARATAVEDRERATWICFLIAYLSPTEGEDPFAGIRLALRSAPAGLPDGDGLVDLAQLPLGPRSSHDPARGTETLRAYGQWVERATRAAGKAAGKVSAGGGGSAPPETVYSHGHTPLRSSGHEPVGGSGGQTLAFSGDPGWSPERRFERLLERLALPGFARMGRYELLLVLGRLGIYELRPGSLHLAGAGGLSVSDPTTLAAKRVFAIGDPLLLEHRAAALAEAVSVPVEILDLALSNWAAPQRATLGFPPEARDEEALGRITRALGL